MDRLRALPYLLSPPRKLSGAASTPYPLEKQELDDVKRDPGEKRNVIADHADVARALEAQILEWVNTNKTIHKEQKLSRDAEERLRALGYIN